MHLLGSFFYLCGIRVLSGFYMECDFFEKVAGNSGVDVFVGNCAHYSLNVSMMKFKVVPETGQTEATKLNHDL